MATVGAPEDEATFVFEMTDALAVAAVVGARTAHSGEDPVGESRDQIRKQLCNRNRGL
jgi:hypothetical protein